MDWIEQVSALIFLFILPGWALLSLLGRNIRLEFGEKVGLSAGLSVSLYPVLFLFFSLFNIAPGPLYAWIPGTTASCYILVQGILKAKRRRNEPNENSSKQHLASEGTGFLSSQALFLFITSLLFVTRMLVIRNMTAPSWGDSVHHTFIVRLMLDHGGLFQSWAPYAPMESFTYHFGFHAAASVWAWLTGASTVQAVLSCGQVLNMLAILALYPLARLLTGSSRSGLGMMLVAGFLFPLPGYFVNWGRYTQLTGQIILSVAIWLIASLWAKKSRTRPGLLILITLTILALGLTHYRVAVMLITATAALTLYGLWVFRRDLNSWAVRIGLLALCGATALLAYLPWIVKFSKSRLPIIFGRSAGYLPKEDFISDLPIWGNTSFYFHDIFWIVALIALLAAFLKRPVLAIFVSLWYSLSFMLANPRMFSLPGIGLLSNEFLIFELYIPIALLSGWLIGFVWKTADVRKTGRIFATVGLLVLLTAGICIQLNIVDPFFQMVMPEDLEAFQWIRSNTSRDACFLVNGFLAFRNFMVVGSDAGWWLPFFTQRKNNVPPVLYAREKLSPTVDWEGLKRIIIDIRASRGDQDAMRAVFCREEITHVFLGEKRGSVGYNQEPLMQESWLRNNPDFILVFQAGKAQVWKFNRDFSP
jgi:hypothetical protein